MQSRPNAARTGTASTRLIALAGAIGDREAVTLGEVLDGLGRAGLGLTILILALPALIPLPGPVGMVLGCCLIIVAVQVIAGSHRLWLPRWLRHRRLPASAVRSMVDRALPWLLRAEARLQHRRMKRLTGSAARSLLGIPILLLAIALALPLPLGNILPVIAMSAIALALLERDGVAVLVALVLSALALAWTVVLLAVGAQITDWLLTAVGIR